VDPLLQLIMTTTTPENPVDSVQAALDQLLAADSVSNMIATTARVIIIIIGGLAVLGFLNRAIKRVVRRIADKQTDEDADSATQEIMLARKAQRIKTLGGLFNNIVRIIVLTIMTLLILGELGFNLAPLLAAGTLVGAALAFGAQQLIADFFSGIFILVEDQYGVGDVVNVGDAEGTIEDVQLRITKLRALDGTLWFVRNGEILSVGNMSQGYSRIVHDVAVGYGANVEQVSRILSEVIDDFAVDPVTRDTILERPELQGMEQVNPDSVVFRIMITTRPGEQWAAARELRLRVKEALDAEDIAVPVPQQMMLMSPGPSGTHMPRMGEHSGERDEPPLSTRGQGPMTTSDEGPQAPPD